MNSGFKKEATGAWIFLSHSHRDLAKVREIRNQLELRGHNPLIFFLKCLEDDSAELPELLKREIEARHWFILCQSQNAEASKWVQEEVKMIQAMEGKTFVTIDLSEDMESQLHKLMELSKRATVFLSYAHADTAMARRMADYLSAVDYSVWCDDEIKPGTHWIEEIAQAIDRAAAHGFVLLLISQNSLKSNYCRDETLYALRKAAESQKSNIIPVYIENPSLAKTEFPYGMQLALAHLQFFDLTSGSFEERMRDLVSYLRKCDME